MKTPASGTESTVRILIVDDDAGQRSLLDTFLRSQGFQTTVVESGERALETLRDGHIAMMVSDVRMPGLTGLETLRRARQINATLPGPARHRLRRHSRSRRRHARWRGELSRQAHRSG